MLIQSIKNFMQLCPYIEGQSVSIGFLGENENSFSITAGDFEPVITQYVCGDYLKQFVFTLSVRAPYGKTSASEGIELLDNIAVWLSEGDLPELGNGRMAQCAEALTQGAVVSNGTDFSKCEMQCRIVYYEKGDI